MEQLLTTEDVARILQVSRRTVERWAALGELKQAPLPGRLLRFREGDLEEMLKR